MLRARIAYDAYGTEKSEATRKDFLTVCDTLDSAHAHPAGRHRCQTTRLSPMTAPARCLPSHHAKPAHASRGKPPRWPFPAKSSGRVHGSQYSRTPRVYAPVPVRATSQSPYAPPRDMRVYEAIDWASTTVPCHTCRFTGRCWHTMAGNHSALGA